MFRKIKPMNAVSVLAALWCLSPAAGEFLFRVHLWSGGASVELLAGFTSSPPSFSPPLFRSHHVLADELINKKKKQQ